MAGASGALFLHHLIANAVSYPKQHSLVILSVSEGSRCPACEILRGAQDDTYHDETGQPFADTLF